MKKNIQGITAVIPGLFRGPAPDPDDIPILKKVWGINKIVSLDGTIGSEIDDAVKKEGIEHVILPIDTSIPHESEPIRTLIRNLKNILTSNGPVYVHCIHGADRTGLAVALLRRTQGWACDMAMREARSFGFGIRLSQQVRNYYISLICSDPDKNQVSDGSVVSKVRQNLEDSVLGDTVIGDTSSRQSFSPITPVPEYPSSTRTEYSQEYPIENNYSPDSLSTDDKKKKKRKQKLRKIYLEDFNDAMAQVGGFQNCNPILRGIGPIEPCGIMPCGYSWAM